MTCIRLICMLESCLPPLQWREEAGNSKTKIRKISPHTSANARNKQVVIGLRLRGLNLFVEGQVGVVWTTSIPGELVSQMHSNGWGISLATLLVIFSHICRLRVLVGTVRYDGRRYLLCYVYTPLTCFFHLCQIILSSIIKEVSSYCLKQSEK